MKILLVNALYRTVSFGGAEVSVDLLVRELLQKGHDVTVLCLDGKRTSFETGVDGVKIVRLRIPNIYWQYENVGRPAPAKLVWHLLDCWNPVTYFRVRSLLAEIKPDVVHSNVLAGFSSSLWSAATDEGIPVVHTVRDFYGICTRVTLYKDGKQCDGQCKGCRVFSFLRRRQMSSEIRTLVGISRFVLERHLCVLGSAVSSAVVYNGMKEQGELSVRTERSENFRVGIIGRLAPEKGVLEFVTAFCARKQLRCELFVAGDGDSQIEASLKKLSEEDPRLHALGRVKATEFYSRIDALVVPSRWNEPFGRIIIEAYEQGVPCLGRRVGGIPELIEHQSTGFIFDEDPEALDCLEILSKDPLLQEQLSVNAKAKSGLFTTARMANAYEEVYAAAVSTPLSTV